MLKYTGRDGNLFKIFDSDTKNVESITKEKIIKILESGIEIKGAFIDDKGVLKVKSKFAFADEESLKRSMLGMDDSPFVYGVHEDRVAILGFKENIKPSGKYFIPDFVTDIRIRLIPDETKSLRVSGGVNLRQYYYNRGTSKFPDYTSIFSSVKNLDVSDLDVSKVTNMGYMFKDCILDSFIPFKGSSANVIKMNNMFNNFGCSGNFSLGFLDTRNCIDMSEMFDYCILKTIDLSCFDTRKVKDMSYMFRDCYSTKVINIDSIKFKEVGVNYEGMFNGKSRSEVPDCVPDFIKDDLVELDY